ncbi:hypothetical protein [Rhodoferax ferrireducens]|uniref:hypothetical protein n=1 Tax=Rhodoferax ferrireducens TaxID=192843 RepID=UPI000E0D49BF|nr:hypothetical protein [Rhodoferax ferrireducens]
MATTDELKKKDGSAVNLGAVRPNPLARGFAPAPAPNSFGDAAAASSNPQVKVMPSAAPNQPAAPGLDAPPVNPARGFAQAPLDQPKMGAMPPATASRGFTPASTPNSFGDAAASSLDARVSQIPATGGAFPAPAPDGKDNTELGRNVGNALSALPGAAPALGAIRGFAGAAKAGGALDAASVGAGALAAKISPYVKPIAGVSALSMAAASGEPSTPTAQTGGATGTLDAPASPGLGATPKPAGFATPGTHEAISQSTGVGMSSSAPQNATPMGALPSPNQVTKTVQANGVTSYSGGPNITGDISLSGNRGGMISTQNNQAAENLARAGGQTSGFGPAGAIRGGGQVSSMDTSAGFAADRKQLAEIDAGKAAQEVNMQSQADYSANKVLEGRALAGNRGALQIMSSNARNKTEQRGQDIQSQGQQLTAGSAKYTADAHVKSQQATNGIAERKLGIEEQKAGAEQAQKEQIAKLDDMIINGNPLQIKMASRQKAAIMGKGLTPEDGKPLAGAALKQLQEVRDTATTIDNLNTSFKDDFAGKGVFGIGADGQLSASANMGVDKGAVAWWKDYRKQAELVERHSMFGASLTPGEQASWRSADIGPGMDKDVIKTNLATRAALTNRIFGNTRQDLIDAGHSEERINAIAGRGVPAGNSTQQPAAPAAPNRTVTRSGTLNGRRVAVYSDGSSAYVD